MAAENIPQGDGASQRQGDGVHPPLNGLYSAESGQAFLPDGRSRRLVQKLQLNADVASRLDPINDGVASRLRDCNPHKYRCGQGKYCSFCSLNRTEKLVKKYKAKLDAISQPIHLTLTSYPVDRLTRKALQDTKDRFRLLREGRRFGRLVVGGLVNIEVDFGQSGWLPHVHAVLDCLEPPSSSFIKREWQRLGGAPQLKLQKVRPGEAHRVFAYSAQAPDIPGGPDHLYQLYQASWGFHPSVAWGTLHCMHGRPPRRLVGSGPKEAKENK